MGKIVSLIKHNELFETLSCVNPKIKEVSKNFKYVEEGQHYDFDNNKISNWFNPDNVKNLGFSRVYPRMCAEQYRSEYSLSIHQSNYLSLFLINLLYQDTKDVLIEDVGCGAGIFFIYLNMLGFTNFNGIDNFSQLNKFTFDFYMNEFGLSPALNDESKRPIISNNVGVTSAVCRSAVIDSAELICCYTNRSLEESAKRVLGDAGYEFLCKDSDDLCFCYCKKEKYEKFTEAIIPYSE